MGGEEREDTICIGDARALCMLRVTLPEKTVAAFLFIYIYSPDWPQILHFPASVS